MKVWMAAVLAVIGIIGLILSLLKLRGGARVALAIISGLVLCSVCFTCSPR
ncbi:MAG: hypothetical protein ACLR5G_02660 [Eubacteriales bacterium]